MDLSLTYFLKGLRDNNQMNKIMSMAKNIHEEKRSLFLIVSFFKKRE